MTPRTCAPCRSRSSLACSRRPDFPRRAGNGYRLEGELESLLGRSFPLPGDADKIREIFAASLADDRLGIPMSREGEHIRYAYPVAVLVADKAAR